MSKQKTNSINKETDICDIGLSTRSYNALTQAGIEKVGDIICKDILQIKEIRNIGKKSFSNIETIIHDCGFLFKGEKANSDLAKLGLKAGTYNSLVYSEITEIAQLIEYEECELLKLPGVGKVAIKDIKEKLSEVGLKLKEKEIMDEDLSILNLSNKSRNVLVHNQIMKIKQLEELSQEELLEMPSVGPVIFAEISEKLKKLGVKQTKFDSDGLRANKIPYVEYFRVKGIKKLEQFTAYTRRELLDMPGIGKRTVEKIEKRLQEKGMELKKQPEDISSLNLRCENTLRNAGINTIEELMLYSGNLMRINKIGVGYADEIARALKEKGINIVETEVVPGDISQLSCSRSLKRAKITTIDELTKYSEEDLLCVRGFGKKTMEEVKEFLKEKGLKLKEF